MLGVFSAARTTSGYVRIPLRAAINGDRNARHCTVPPAWQNSAENGFDERMTEFLISGALGANTPTGKTLPGVHVPLRHRSGVSALKGHRQIQRINRRFRDREAH